MLVDDPANRKSIAVIFEYAQYLVPPAIWVRWPKAQAARLVRFLSWAQNPHIKRVNMAFCLSPTGWPRSTTGWCRIPT